MATRHVSKVRAATALAVAMAVLVGAGCTPRTGGGSASVPLGADCTGSPNVAAGARLAGCLLAGLDLAGLDLTGIDLRGADLTGSNLSGANLTDANLEGAILTNADLSGANLTRAVLSGAVLLGALFIGAILVGTNFDIGTAWVASGAGGGGPRTASNTTGVGTNQAFNDRGEPWCESGGNPGTGRRSTITSAATDFTNATFEWTWVSEGSQGTLQGLDFRTANFTGATINFLDNAPWWPCQSFAGGRFHNATLIGFASQNFDMSNSDFSGATFVHNSLCQADFSGSNLAGARFIGGTDSGRCADYSSQGWNSWTRYGISFNGANLTGARFGGLPAVAASYTSPQYGTGPWVTGFEMRDPSTWQLVGGPDFRGADLTGAIFESVSMGMADFTGATTTGIAVSNDPYANSWQQALFGSGGWAGSSWSGWNDFTDATCPDGSTGSWATPCF